GHQVWFATGRDRQGTVEQAGLPFVDAGLTLDEATAELTARYPESSEVAPRGQQAVHALRLLVYVYAPRMVESLLEPSRQWQPDAIVYDLTAFAGPLLAVLLGRPAVSHSVGPALPVTLMRKVETALSPLWQSYGLTVSPAAGTLVGPRVETWPAALQLPGTSVARQSWPVRTVVAPAGSEPAASVADRGDRPRVHVTFGTVYDEPVADEPAILEHVLGSLENEPYDITATSASADTRRPSDIRWVPRSEALPACDIVVCHAGVGTVLRALASGLPLVLLPRDADHIQVAEGCVRAGVATRVPTREASPDKLRAAIRTALRSTGLRNKARGLQRQLAEMPSPAELVPAIEALARDEE
ncbi:MAG: glycosyltransferase, partial [Sciscionella sp.]